jgi:hypothetical protein
MKQTRIQIDGYSGKDAPVLYSLSLSTQDTIAQLETANQTLSTFLEQIQQEYGSLLQETGLLDESTREKIRQWEADDAKEERDAQQELEAQRLTRLERDKEGKGTSREAEEKEAQEEVVRRNQQSERRQLEQAALQRDDEEDAGSDPLFFSFHPLVVLFSPFLSGTGRYSRCCCRNSSRRRSTASSLHERWQWQRNRMRRATRNGSTS